MALFNIYGFQQQQEFDPAEPAVRTVFPSGDSSSARAPARRGPGRCGARSHADPIRRQCKGACAARARGAAACTAACVVAAQSRSESDGFICQRSTYVLVTYIQTHTLLPWTYRPAHCLYTHDLEMPQVYNLFRSMNNLYGCTVGVKSNHNFQILEPFFQKGCICSETKAHASFYTSSPPNQTNINCFGPQLHTHCICWYAKHFFHHRNLHHG